MVLYINSYTADDYRKAFDLIHRTIQVNKLKEYDIHIIKVNWMINFLSIKADSKFELKFGQSKFELKLHVSGAIFRQVFHRKLN